MEDRELLEAWRRGDTAAGQTLVSRCLGSLTRFFNNKVVNPADVSELVSETMLACVESRDAVKTTFRGFMYATAMNILRSHYRKQLKRKREFDDFAEVCVGDTEHPGALAARVDLSRELRLLVRALRRVSLDQQIVLELNYIEELDGREIARLLEIPEQTVYSRLRRGKQQLRVIMTELSEDPTLVESTLHDIEAWASKVRGHVES